MREELKAAYLALFGMSEKDFTLVGLKYIGKHEKQNSDGSLVYNFFALLTAPSTVRELIPTNNEGVELHNTIAPQQDNIGGPSFAHQVEWKKKVDENGKERIKKKCFEIRGDVKPATVLDWEIFDNKYYIKVEAYGTF